MQNSAMISTFMSTLGQGLDMSKPQDSSSIKGKITIIIMIVTTIIIPDP